MCDDPVVRQCRFRQIKLNILTGYPRGKRNGTYSTNEVKASVPFPGEKL